MVKLILIALVGLSAVCWSEAAPRKVWSPSVRKDAGRDKTGVIRIPLENKNNHIYCGTIELGTPAKKFSMAFDNSLPSTWVIDSSCNQSECNQRQKYDGSQSTSHKKDGRAYNLYYEDKMMSGTLNIDTLSMGGVTILNQTFATTQTFPSDDLSCDGVISVQKGSLVFGTDFDFPMQNMIKQKLLREPIFSMYMSKNDTTKGEILFGAIDHSRYEGSMSWAPSTDSLYWIFQMYKVQVTDSWRVMANACDSFCLSSFNSMNPFTVVNSKAFVAFNQALGAVPYDKNHYYFKDCKFDSKLMIYMSLEELIIKITSDMYVYKVDKPDGPVCFSAIATENGGYEDDYWSLGYNFMRAIYTVYDLEYHQIGIASSK